MARLFLYISMQSCILILVACFQNKILSKNPPKSALQSSLLPPWLQGVLHVLSNETLSHEPRNQEQTKSGVATVVRLAARSFDKDGASKPSSRYYTTRKNTRNRLVVTREGVEDDYNHYRTTALKSTPNRAISLLTTDVMQALQSNYSPLCQNGDLGENILLDNIAFGCIKVGRQYTFSSSDSSSLVIEVTEPMTPCSNLCKLPYVNDDSLSPKQRIQKCQALLEFLDKPGDGFRGWYAKVVTPGTVCVGDEFREVNEQ